MGEMSNKRHHLRYKMTEGIAPAVRRQRVKKAAFLYLHNYRKMIMQIFTVTLVTEGHASGSFPLPLLLPPSCCLYLPPPVPLAPLIHLLFLLLIPSYCSRILLFLFIFFSLIFLLFLLLLSSFVHVLHLPQLPLHLPLVLQSLVLFLLLLIFLLLF